LRHGLPSWRDRALPSWLGPSSPPLTGADVGLVKVVAPYPYVLCVHTGASHTQKSTEHGARSTEHRGTKVRLGYKDRQMFLNFPSKTAASSPAVHQGGRDRLAASRAAGTRHTRHTRHRSSGVSGASQHLEYRTGAGLKRSIPRHQCDTGAIYRGDTGTVHKTSNLFSVPAQHVRIELAEWSTVISLIVIAAAVRGEEEEEEEEERIPTACRTYLGALGAAARVTSSLRRKFKRQHGPKKLKSVISARLQ